MNMFYIVLITLVVYSLISTIVYVITKGNEDVFFAFGLGITGLIMLGIMKAICKVRDLFKYRIGKRSIFEEEGTGNKYKCKLKDTKDVQYWTSCYKLIKRYATKSEWVGIPDFSEEFMENSKKNCDHCKHDNECQREPYTRVKCKHDEYGCVIEFDKFEKGKHIWAK